jgi:hypothetical protein
VVEGVGVVEVEVEVEFLAVAEGLAAV